MQGHPGVAGRVRLAEHLLISAVVAGELIFGFQNGSRQEENMADLKAFLDNPYVEFLPVSLTTADRFGRIAASLRRKGTLIPTNDIWIAAHALQSGAELLSFDRHFAAVDGLIWIRP
jgi:predicted nucleic acid-binding protein